MKEVIKKMQVYNSYTYKLEQPLPIYRYKELEL